MQVVWLDSAVNDLVRLREFIEKNNPIAANKAAHKIIEVAKMLEEQPELGKPAKDLPTYRDLNIKFGMRGYILRYRIYEDILYVVQLRHHRESGFKH